MTNAGPNSDASMREARRNAFGERLTDATGRSQPLAPANATWPGQTPPTTPAQERMLWASGAPFGSALWMAFVFGLACATYWAMFSTILAVTLPLFVLSPLGNHPNRLFTILGFLLDIAAPVAVIVVAWRERRRIGGGGGLVGALLALAVIAFAPATLVIVLAMAPQTTPLASALATWMDPLTLGTLESFRAMPLFVIFGTAASVGVLALAAAYAWGEPPAGTHMRWLALVRGMGAGLSAAVGFTLFNFAFQFLRDFIYNPPGSAAIQQTVSFILLQYSFTYPLVLTLIASALGGGLAWISARTADDGAIALPVQPTRAPARWGRAIGVGALLVALGIVSAVWLPVLAWFDVIFLYSTPGYVIFVVVALAPTFILIWAYLAMRRRFGAASAWRIVGVAALGATPLLIGVLLYAFADKLSWQTVAYVVYVGAPIGLVFGVGVTVGAIFGDADATRWRGRASAIGALVGFGYALTMYALASELAHGRSAAQCSGFVGCVLGAALLNSNESFLLTFGVYGFGLALAGGLVGGWLRARATLANARLVTAAGR